jgi:predicted flap endonuclease-1-like 5' DNA nuclease
VAAPSFGRGVIASDGFVSVADLAAEAAAAAVDLDAEADAQALGELLMETDLPLAEVEVLQAGADSTEPTEDDLTLIDGIGPVYAGRLREHGIVTFAHLAQTAEDELAAIIQAPAWRRPSFADWIAQAQLAAAGEEDGLAALQDELFSRRGENLTLIDGLGEKYAAALQNGGIADFAALAAATPEQVASIVGEAGLRSANFSAWISEAAQRAAGKRVARHNRNADIL